MAKEKQKVLIYKALEHITNVTNVGLRLSEVENDLVISYPVLSSKTGVEGAFPENLPKAELIFRQVEGNELRVSHKFPEGSQGYAHEEVAAIPAASVHERIIYESVINFLKKVNKS